MFVTAADLFLSFALGAIIWFPLCIISLHGHAAFRRKFPKNALTPLVFPTLWTAVWTLVSTTPLAASWSPAYSLMDFAPLQQLAAFVGVQGINFLNAWLAVVLEAALAPHLLQEPCPAVCKACSKGHLQGEPATCLQRQHAELHATHALLAGVLCASC